MFDHVAIRVRNLAASRRFYEAALAPLGYRIVAEYPGIFGMGASPDRADYHPNYYGAFAWDLDGNNIEAVCHTPG